MHLTTRLLPLILVVFCVVTMTMLPASAQPPIGGDQGWYAVHCNVDGASVYFDSTLKGVIEGGVLYVPAYVTGTPYSTYQVMKDGYTTATGTISSVPGKGEVLDLYATLNPITTTQPTSVGGDIGWYVVHCNVNGATVMFDNEVKGVINQGTLTVQVFTTGTPYKTYTVTMPGYSTFTGTIDRVPAKGEQVDLYATLNALPPSPTTTRAPVPVGLVLIALIAGIVAYGMERRK